MEFVTFTPVHAALVANWPRSCEEAVMWCGEREFPMLARTVEDWQRDEETQAHLLIVGDVPVGYGELWHDPSENEAELARIIVAPDARGKGYGRALVRGLLSEAVQAGYPDIFMRVHPDNSIALGCYQGAGFAPVDARLTSERNTGQPVTYVWLRHDAPAPGH